MFCDLLYCADRGSRLCLYTDPVDKALRISAVPTTNNTKGTCEIKQDICANAIEQVAIL